MSRFALIAVTALVALLTLPSLALARPRLDGFERSVLRQVNQARAAQGLSKLSASRPLSRAADTHSGDMLRSDFFDHASSDGTPFDRRVRRYADVGMVGETLASLPRRRGGAATIVQMWLDSPPHRAIVLHVDFERIGIGRRWGTLGATPNAVVTADFAS